MIVGEYQAGVFVEPDAPLPRAWGSWDRSLGKGSESDWKDPSLSDPRQLPAQKVQTRVKKEFWPMVWVSAREGKETEVRSFKDREGISMRDVSTWIRCVVADIWGRRTRRTELRTKGSLVAGLTCWGGACESPSGFWEAVSQQKQKCTALCNSGHLYQALF